MHLKWACLSNLELPLGLAMGLPVKILCLHGAMTMALPYAQKRIRMHALSNSWPDAPSFDRRRRLWELLTKLESVHASLSLLSFLLFLWNGRYVSFLTCRCLECFRILFLGRYRTITDRILGLRLVPTRALLNRNVSYEFMNRQMVWHAFTVRLFY